MAYASTHPLLVQLLNAVAAGGLLAAPGCGAVSDDSDDSSNPVERGEEPEAAALEPEAAVLEPEAEAPDGGAGAMGMAPDNGGGGGEGAIGPVEPEAAAPMCEYGMPTDFCLDRAAMEQQARFGGGQIPLDPPRSEAEVAAGYDGNGCMRHDWVMTSCCNPALATGVPRANGECCYVACEGSCCGRPFVIDGAVLTAQASGRRDWVLGVRSERRLDGERRLHGESVLGPAAGQLLAVLWLEDALMEHASVASFARFTLDLLALGAPPDLVRDAQQASLDEIEHAQACFGVAALLSGNVRGPGPLAANGFTPRGLFDSLRAAVHEGCVGETLAAGIVQEQARCSTDPRITRVLERIGADELRHAELAFRFVAWAIAVHGEVARQVVQDAFAEALARAPAPPPSPLLAPEELHRGGRLTTHEWSREAEHLFAEVIRPAAAASVRVQRRAA
jgi:hypothetical protein